MTRFRKWILSVGIALALLLPLGAVASADPGDPGGTGFTSSTTRTTSTSPSHGGPAWGGRTADPGDPGGSP